MAIVRKSSIIFPIDNRSGESLSAKAFISPNSDTTSTVYFPNDKKKVDQHKIMAKKTEAG